MTESKISWTEITLELVLGCERVSAGCQNCYAERLTARFEKNPVFGDRYHGLLKHGSKGPAWNGTVRTAPEELLKALAWKRPRKIFVCSRSDLFHPDVPFSFIAKVFGVIAATPQHTYQILTKRPERMAEFFRTVSLTDATDAARTYMAVRSFPSKNAHYDRLLDLRQSQWPLPNAWLGTSTEDQEAADKRIPHIIQCPAIVRFVSVEPLLGAVDLREYMGLCFGCQTCEFAANHSNCESRIHWVIAGAESGPRARPMEMAWARTLRDQCKQAGVPYYFKQQGGIHSNVKPWIVEADHPSSAAFNGMRHKIQQYPNPGGTPAILGVDEHWFPETLPWVRVDWRCDQSPEWSWHGTGEEFNEDACRERVTAKLVKLFAQKGVTPTNIEIRVKVFKNMDDPGAWDDVRAIEQTATAIGLKIVE